MATAAGPDTIVIVNDFAHVNGGAAQVALESAKALAGRGLRVILFTAVEPIDESLAESGVEVICIGQQEIARDPDRIRAFRQGLWNQLAADKFTTVLNDLNPRKTIVHVHGWTKSLSSSVIRAAIDKSFSIILTLHDYFCACPNGGFFDYKKNVICTRRALSFDCISTNCDKQSFGHKLYRVARQRKQTKTGRIPSGIKHFISISGFSLNILKPYLPADAIVHSVLNPIFIDKTEPAEPAKCDHFLVIGRLSPEKGISLAAEAAAQARVKLTIVGDGELRGQLETRFLEVTFAGWQDRAGIIDHLRSSRALILPSLWYETQGMVVAEAAALGIPAIVPDTCAARDMVVDGTNGLWFTGGDAADLADKITLLNDSETTTRMGQAAFNTFWASPPTIQAHTDQLLAVYRRMLN